ncbi:MAG: fumarylacetoacetate hydrolase family protein [bacterium]
MRLVTYRRDKETRTGALEGKHLADLAEASAAAGTLPLPTDMVALLEMGAKGLRAARAAARYARRHPDAGLLAPAGKARLEAPVPCPRKLLAVAGNYAEHIQESYGATRAKKELTPRVFMKPPSTTVNRPGGRIRLYRKARFVDWEVELGVVMGRKAKYVAAKDAARYIAGYTVVNDISEREFAVRSRTKEEPIDRFFDWLNGKWPDGFAPMGPCLVTADEIEDPQALDLRLRVNGETMQEANTGQMIYTCAELVAYISQWITLEPGDVLATGTPAGVGMARGIKLKAGDVVEAEVEKIGVLKNTVAREGKAPRRG